MSDWEKYGLSLFGAQRLMTTAVPNGGYGLYTVEETMDYYTMVHICHDAVASYLNEHPEIVYRSEGNRYYDILKVAFPEMHERITAWVKNYVDRTLAYQIRFKYRFVPVEVK